MAEWSARRTCNPVVPDSSTVLGSVSGKPANFSGPKSNFEIEIQRIRAQVLSNKLLHCVSLTDSFIMLDAKLLKTLSCM